MEFQLLIDTTKMVVLCQKPWGRGHACAAGRQSFQRREPWMRNSFNPQSQSPSYKTLQSNLLLRANCCKRAELHLLRAKPTANRQPFVEHQHGSPLQASFFRGCNARSGICLFCDCTRGSTSSNQPHCLCQGGVKRNGGSIWPRLRP